MSTNIRTFLAILLSFLVVFVYQYFFAKNLETQKQEQTQAQPGQQQTAAPAAAPGASALTAPAKTPAAKAATAPAARDIRIETPLYTAVFSTRGGALKSFKLKEYKATLEENSPLIEMVQVLEGSELPLSVAFTDSSLNLPGDAPYEADRKELDLTKETRPGKLVFSHAAPGQYRVEKIFTFYPDRYSFDLEVRFQNSTTVPLSENANLIWLAEAGKKDAEQEEGAIAQVKSSTEREAAAKLEKKLYGPDVQWGGFESKFFLGAMIPKQPALTSIAFNKDSRGQIVVSLEGPKNTIPQGQAGIFGYTVYVGPKDYTLLKQQDVGTRDGHQHRQLDEVARVPVPLRDAVPLQVRGQLRDCHHHHHRSDEDHLLAAGEQELQVHEGDAESPAQDDGAEGTLQGRQTEAQCSRHGALQDAQDQPPGRVPAGGHPDPRVHRSLPAALLRHRASPCALCLVDPGPLGQGPLLHHPHHHGRDHADPAEDDAAPWETPCSRR